MITKLRNTNYPKKFVLEKKVKIERYLVKTQYKIKQHRKDLLVILKFIEEYNSQNKNVTPEVIQKELLMLPLIGIKRLLHRLADLELIEINITDGLVPDDYPLFLTDKGRYSILQDNVFLPSEAILEFSVIDDPLFDSYFYGISETPKDTNKNLNQSNNNKEELVDITKSTKISNYIGKKINGEIVPYPKGEIIIEQIDKNGIRLPPKSAVFSIEITEKNNVKAFIKENKSQGQGFPINFSLQTNLKFKNLFNIFKTQYLPKNWKDDYFLVKSSELNTQEKRGFYKKKLQKESFKVDENIFVDRVVLYNAQVQPINAQEANSWLEELVIDDINYFLTKEEFDSIVLNHKTKFVFHQEQLELKLTEVIETIKNKVKAGVQNWFSKYWYLQAPIDLKRWD